MQEVLQWLICDYKPCVIVSTCLLNKKNIEATEMTTNLQAATYWKSLYKIHNKLSEFVCEYSCNKSWKFHWKNFHGSIDSSLNLKVLCFKWTCSYTTNIHESAKLLTPKVTRSRSNRIPWSTVSNAAERSSKTSMAVSSRSTASRRSESTSTIAVSVECPRRKPDWVENSRWLASR